MKLRMGVALLCGDGSVSLTATERPGIVLLGVSDGEKAVTVTLTVEELQRFVQVASAACIEVVVE